MKYPSIGWRTTGGILRRACLTAALPLLLIAVLFSSTASAWFYFPAPENVTVQSAPAVPFQMAAYRLDGINGAVCIATASDETIDVDLDMTFFQWGNKYFCEGDTTHYYALEYTYDSDALFASSGKLMLQAVFTANMTITPQDQDKNNQYVRFPFYTVSYAFGGNAGVALENYDYVAYHEARAASYSDLIGKGDILMAETAPTNAAVHLDTTALCTLSDLPLEAFRFLEQKEEKLRLIIYIQVDVNEDDLTQRLNTIDMGDANELALATTLNLSCDFRTIPAYKGASN